MTKLMIRLILANNTVKSFCYVLLMLMNVGHAVVHGTPLDSGMMDAMIANANAWLLTVATS